MAAIPTYLYFGDDLVSGGVEVDTALPTIWGFGLANPKFSRVTPSSADGVSVPGSNNYEPYWDGSVSSGTGAFVRYHHVQRGYIAGANGDNWYKGGGGGVTPCTLFMASLWERYPTSPGFRFLKYGKDGAGYSSWKPGGAAWTEAMAEWDKMVVAAGSDTLDVKHVVLDCSASSIVEQSLTFVADAQACITAIKSTFGSSVKITLVSHRADFYLPGGDIAATARRLHQGLKLANTNVRIFDMSWAEFGNDSPFPISSVAPGPDQIRYQTANYVDMGARIGRFLYQWDTGLPLGTTGGALEVHVMLGDSNLLTANMVPSIVVLGDQESLLGPPNGTERVGQWIYDGQNDEVIPYNVAGVTNSMGSIESWWGPENTLLKRAKQYAEDRVQSPDVCVWKFAAGGASMLFADSALPVVQENWDKFKAAVFRDTGRTIDCRSILCNLGRNDGLVQAGADYFAGRYLAFVDEIRDIFSTRADGDELAVVWVQPSPHADSGIIGGTTVGESAPLDQVRALVADLPNQRPRIGVLLDPAVPGANRVTYELQRVDGLHYGAEATFAVGYNAADAVHELNTSSDEGGTDEESQEDSPSGSAAFVVETGTGSATANSYCTVAFADSYHDAYGNPTLWLSATQAAKQNALRLATEALDIRYASRWCGTQFTSEQALAWPRSYVVDPAGNLIGTDTIPTRLAQATARAALLHLEGEALVPDTLDTASIASESRSMAGGFSKSVTYQGGKPATTQFPVVDRILIAGGLITAGTAWSYADA